MNKKHAEIPIRVGTANAARVHFMLPVSFFTVKSVVEQGQCIREKRITFIAVTAVQPFEIKRFFISKRESESVSVPADMYDIMIRGITISFAGKPSMNARRIVPSIPSIRAKGSRKDEAW